MAAEKKRGCGYRKVGGLYLVAEGLSMPCGKLPFELGICPTCGGGIKFSRGFTWITPSELFTDTTSCGGGKCLFCPVGSPPEGQHGLLWTGERHYTVETFTKEAAEMGPCKRIKTVPHDFKLGETWVYLAHKKCIPDGKDEDGKDRFKAGIFTAFKPTRIELIITQSQSEDEEFMAKVEKRGLTPVIVPDDDPDHAAEKRGSSDD